MHTLARLPLSWAAAATDGTEPREKRFRRANIMPDRSQSTSIFSTTLLHAVAIRTEGVCGIDYKIIVYACSRTENQFNCYMMEPPLCLKQRIVNDSAAPTSIANDGATPKSTANDGTLLIGGTSIARRRPQFPLDDRDEEELACDQMKSESINHEIVDYT